MATYQPFSWRLSDVLSRHRERCERATLQTELPRTTTPSRRPRLRKACLRCAQSKTRCDTQHPCYRCSNKRLSCEYDTEGTSYPSSIHGSICVDMSPRNFPLNEIEDAFNGDIISSSAQQLTNISAVTIDGKSVPNNNNNDNNNNNTAHNVDVSWLSQPHNLLSTWGDYMGLSLGAHLDSVPFQPAASNLQDSVDELLSELPLNVSPHGLPAPVHPGKVTLSSRDYGCPVCSSSIGL